MEYFPPSSGPLANVTRPVAVLKHAPKQLASVSGLQFTAGYAHPDIQAKLKTHARKTAAQYKAGSRHSVTRRGRAAKPRQTSTSRSAIQQKYASRVGRRPSTSVRSSRKK